MIVKTIRLPENPGVPLILTHFCIVMRPRHQNGEREPHLYVRLAAMDRGSLWEERWAVESHFVGDHFNDFVSLFLGQQDPFYAWVASKFGGEVVDVEVGA